MKLAEREKYKHFHGLVAVKFLIIFHRPKYCTKPSQMYADDVKAGDKMKRLYGVHLLRVR